LGDAPDSFEIFIEPQNLVLLILSMMPEHNPGSRFQDIVLFAMPTKMYSKIARPLTVGAFSNLHGKLDSMK
jgi:hypothetical protein